EPLAMEQAEALSRPVGNVEEMAQLEGVDASFLRLRPSPFTARRRRDEHVPEHRDPSEGPWHLMRTRDAEVAAARSRTSGDVLVAEVHRPVRRPLDARKDVDQR